MLIVMQLDVSGSQLKFPEVDSLTYHAYLNEDWKTLKQVGTMAIDSGIDYYYLRMRLGIAYFETLRYRMSVKHFKRALYFNESSQTAREYLYFAYLYGGISYNITERSTYFDSAFLKKMDHENTFIQSIGFDYTYGINESLQKKFPDGLNGITESFAKRPEKYRNIGINIKHRLGNRINIRHGFTKLTKQNLVFSNTGTTPPTIRYAQVVGQFQYYISPIVFLDDGLHFWLSAHFLNIDIPYRYAFDGSVYSGENTENDQAFTTGLSKDFSHFNISFGLGYSTLNNKQQFSQNIELVYYPLANLNLYGLLHIKTQQDGSFVSGPSSIHPGIGFKVFRHAWIEGGYTIGSMDNYSDINGFYIYNDINPVTKLATGSLIVPFNKYKTSVFIKYRYLQNNIHVFSITSDEYVNSGEYQIVHSITGGLSWIF